MLTKKKKLELEIKLASKTYATISDIREFSDEEYDYICKKYNDGYKVWGDFLRNLISRGVIPVASCAGHDDEEDDCSYLLLFAPGLEKTTKIVSGLFKDGDAEVSSRIIHFDNAKGLGIYFPFENRDMVIDNIITALDSEEFDKKLYEEIVKLDYLDDAMRSVSLNATLGISAIKRDNKVLFSLRDSSFDGCDMAIYDEYVKPFMKIVDEFIDEYFVSYVEEVKSYVPCCYKYNKGYELLVKYVEALLMYKENNPNMFYQEDNLTKKLVKLN